ncbi:ABC transporter substrate-binding protein [Pseudonocardia hydrocarbonoxydans]|uniref:Glycine/betaine ABC transporter substrate-binding protein n=1 Tax=Pseudonocardia hydrocarbonoxydans TaxID=76726 RepID=A0A4Y3WKS4_9PSEU|nr:ABC transporter substrate-binding protein [Pseudonocardia hydrocarbonoxydans]GEC19384.1 glycine/betaine ABC transporter substrate-binding protein [Pseudonocardia hydrocarbonoxydans]
MTTFLRVAGVVAALGLALSACGGGGDPLAGGGTGETGDASAPIRIGSAAFPENQLLGEIYGQALEAQGVAVEILQPIASREAYFPGLRDGSIDLVPEYTGVLLQYLEPAATEKSADEVYAALQGVIPEGLTLLERSDAENKDAVVVTQEFATANNLTTIEDLAPLCPTITFGGPPEFQERPDGIPGIEATYGCTFAGYSSLDVGGPLTVTALRDGTVQAADLFTTDPTIESNGFVALEDPLNNFAAQNVVPLVNTAKASDQVQQVLNDISSRLTTEVLIDLNGRLAADDRPNPDTVAQDWLTEQGLL